MAILPKSFHAPPSPLPTADEPRRCSPSPDSSVHRVASPSSAALHLGSKDNSADESLEKNSMDQGDFMVEFVEDTMDQVVEDSMEDEENDSFGEFDEDSMEYLRGRVVEDSEEENNKDEAYLKVKKEVDLRSARDDALRREAKAKNAPRHKRRMKKIFTDFLRIYVPSYFKKGKK